MTPQESQALQDFLNQLTEVRGIAKDPEADALIARAVSQQPDAAYLLTQRAMLLERALDNAKEQIADLKKQAQAVGTSRTDSFLDSGSAWGRSAVSRPQPPVSYSANDQTPVMPATARGGRPGFFGGQRGNFMGGGGGSFLGGLAATAAGVAGGAFLFQGIQNLMGNDNAQQAGKSEAHDSNAVNAEPASLDDSSADLASTNFDSSGLDTGLDSSDFGSEEPV